MTTYNIKYTTYTPAQWKIESRRRTRRMITRAIQGVLFLPLCAVLFALFTYAASIYFGVDDVVTAQFAHDFAAVSEAITRGMK